MADVFSFDHQGLEYLNMAMAQVTDNPAMVDGSSIHQEAKQHMQTGKPLVLRREETIQRELSLIPRVMMRHGGTYITSDNFPA